MRTKSIIYTRNTLGKRIPKFQTGNYIYGKTDLDEAFKKSASSPFMKKTSDPFSSSSYDNRANLEPITPPSQMFPKAKDPLKQNATSFLTKKPYASPTYSPNKALTLPDVSNMNEQASSTVDTLNTSGKTGLFRNMSSGTKAGLGSLTASGIGMGLTAWQSNADDNRAETYTKKEKT
ncbi:MAG: hypothetical protein DRQ35_07290, partial [Gammaproteobacteria bacterium]